MSNWTVSRETILPKGDNPMGNNFYGYRKVDLDLPDGRTATYHGVIPGDCVHVLAVEDDLTTYLVRQKRPNALPAGGRIVPVTLELPGGFARQKLGLETSAREEAREEIGRNIGNLLKIGELYPSTGLSNEVDTIYLGTGLSIAEDVVHSEATEQDLRIVTGKFGELMDDLRRGGQPVSAQALAAFALAEPHL